MVKVFLDPGHGGTDSGAVGNSLLEKVLTRKIVDYAHAHLVLGFDNVEVNMSRDEDETKSLKQRTDEANAWGADVFVSVHINSAESVAANGFESHIYPTADESTQALQNIIHTEVMQVNRAFGITNDRGKKRSNFHVLRESHMDAVLTENLFIKNTFDANRLKDEAYLRAVGEAHARGIAKRYGLPAKAAPLTPVYTVTARDFSSKEEADAFANFIRTTQYSKIGLYIDRLR